MNEWWKNASFDDKAGAIIFVIFLILLCFNLAKWS